jgi:hypothetical protein
VAGALLRPQKQAAGRAAGRQRIQRRLVGPLVEELGPGRLLRAPHRHRLPAGDTRHGGRGVVEVADLDRLGRAHHDAGRFETDVQTVRAEVALLGRVIFGVDEDRVVGTGRHAGLATDADPFVEVDDAVGPPVHGRGGAGGDTGRVLALVAARHLKGPTGLRKRTHVDVFDVGSVHAQRNVVLGLAGRAAGMASNARRLVDDLGPASRGRTHRPRLGRGHPAASPREAPESATRQPYSTDCVSAQYCICEYR